MRTESNGVVTYRNEGVVLMGWLGTGLFALLGVAALVSARTQRERIWAVILLLVPAAFGWTASRYRIELHPDHVYAVTRNKRRTFRYEQLRDPVLLPSGLVMIADRHEFVEVPKDAELQQELRERIAARKSLEE